LENRIDRATPLAVELLQQFLGRRDAARDRFLERAQIARLVATIAVEQLAARKPARSEMQCFLRERKQIDVADLRLEAEFRNIVAQLLPLLRGPVLHQIPAGIERIVVVKQTDPEGSERRQPPPWATIGAAHLEVTLEPHLGKNRTQVIGPIG